MKLTSITGLLVFAGMEIVLRMGLFPGYSEEATRPSIYNLQDSAASIGHSYLGYALKPNMTKDHGQPHRLTTHNSEGYRGELRAVPKPEGVYRILCLGGSSTHGTTPNTDADTWPARLEHHLTEATGKKIEVINFGVFGYSTFESLVNLSFRGVKLEPDLVLVYHSINDMRCALYNAGGEVKSDNSHWRAIWPEVMPSPGEQLLEKSLVYCALRKEFTGYLARFKVLDAFAIVNYDPFAEDPYANEVVSPVGFDSYRNNLTSIVAVAKSHGAKTMLISQAMDRADIKVPSRQLQWDSTDRLGRIQLKVSQDTGAGYCEARPVLEQAFAKVSAETQAKEVRSKELMRSSDPSEVEEGRKLWMEFSREGVFTGDVHLTDNGANILAEAIAQSILKGDYLPK
ncbi:MAG: GDSL-type esterase/lipase family protein [Planctomycetota bacterium]|nr:GDSL-type esterase/lipase family protein [Planctomycetota bacterium]